MQTNVTQKGTLINSITLKIPMLRRRTESPFMTSGQETEWVRSFNPRSLHGTKRRLWHRSSRCRRWIHVKLVPMFQSAYVHYYWTETALLRVLSDVFLPLTLGNLLCWCRWIWGQHLTVLITTSCCTVYSAFLISRHSLDWLRKRDMTLLTLLLTLLLNKRQTTCSHIRSMVYAHLTVYPNPNVTWSGLSSKSTGFF